MKKAFKALAALVVLGVGGYFGYQYDQGRQAEIALASDAGGYTEYVVGKGNLSKSVTGTGTLSVASTEDVTLPYAVTVEETLVEAGEAVEAGQALLAVDTDALRTALDSLQTELSDCESGMATIANSYSSTLYVKMPQDGRIKEVYIEAGQYLEDVMAQKGCIALLSLDGKMYAEIGAAEGMAISSAVKVTVGRTALDGVVRKIENGKATVTFSDAYGAEGQDVSVSFQGVELGTAQAHINMPYQLTSTEKGYIHTVYIEADARKWEGNRVAYLINVPVSEEYKTLESTREKLNAQISDLKVILTAGTVNAPTAGVVKSVAAASYTEQAAYTALASLYVGDEKQMVVTVDELDIINVAVGQEAEIAMDAITGQSYSAEVARVSQIGTATSGVTVYDVTLKVEGDEKLKLGMNGTATIKIEEVEDVLLVPISAMSSSRNGSYVWVAGAEESAAEGEPGVKTFVETGLSDENYAQVKSGLSEGDVVLLTREASTASGGQQNQDMMMFSMDGGAMPGGGDLGQMGGTPPSGGGRSGGN